LDRLLATLWAFLLPEVLGALMPPPTRNIDPDCKPDSANQPWLHPDQPNAPDDQILPASWTPKTCSTRLRIRDRVRFPGLPICQFLVPASFTLKMLPVFPLLQLLELFLRTVRRVRPHIPTAVILIQKFLKDLTVMDRRWRHVVISESVYASVDVDMILVAVVVLPFFFVQRHRYLSDVSSARSNLRKSAPL